MPWQTDNKWQSARFPSPHVSIEPSKICTGLKMKVRTVIQLPQITLPQHTSRLSCTVVFSVCSAYCGGIAESNDAQVQHASSPMEYVSYQRSRQILEVLIRLRGLPS